MILAGIEDYVGYLVLAAIVIIIILIIVLKVIDNVKNNRVKRVSPYYLAIVELNKKTHFKLVDQGYKKYSQKLNSKRQFDNFNYSKKCVEFITNHSSTFIGIVNAIEYNKTVYANYIKEVNSTKHTTDEKLAKINKMSLKSMVIRETKLAKKIIKDAVTDYNITVTASYTSPQGRNSYRGHNAFNYSFIKNTVAAYRPKQVGTINSTNSGDQTVNSTNQNNSNYRPSYSPKTSKTINSIDDLEEID